jgi:uncharacterized protein YbaP (TraB family)
VTVWTRLWIAVAAAFICASAGASAEADPAIWRVIGPHATVYLVGSTPVAPADGKWKTPALQQAAASAQEIWFVTPFGLPGPITAVRMLTTMTTKGYLPYDQRLTPKLSPDGRARLGRLAARYGVNLDKLDRMTPWNADINLALAARRKDGSMQGVPVERYIMAQAPNAPKRALDNLEEDLKLLISTPESDQVYDLEEAMRRDEDAGLNQRYGEAWASGDQGWIEREREQRLEAHAPTTYRLLQLEPRRRWADQIGKLSQGSKTVIVVLDAANMVGQNGLPALLRRKGLQVEGP